MGRSGWSGDWEPDHNGPYLWPAIVRRAMTGPRGQAFIRALIVALDAMPVKELIEEQIACPEGVCALGAAIRHFRPEELAVDIDPEDHEFLARLVNVPRVVVQNIEYENDECGRCNETPAERWARMRRWAEQQIVKETADAQPS